MSEISVLAKARKEYQPKLPVSLRKGTKNVTIATGAPTESIKTKKLLKNFFQIRMVPQ